MNILNTVEMKMKLSNVNLSLSDKIDLVSELIREFSTIRENLRINEVLAFRSGDKDKWCQLRKDGRTVSNYIGELARLKIKLIDVHEVIIEENYNKIMNFLQSI